MSQECPYIDRSFEPDPEFNDKTEFKCQDGYVYIYYIHWSRPDHKYDGPVQFCMHVGRKKDVFECLNENEWKRCPHYSLPYPQTGERSI